MEPKLIPLHAPDDIATVHDTALRLGKLSGLAVNDQIVFASAAAQLAQDALNTRRKITFRLEQVDDICFLIADTGNHTKSVRQQVSRIPNLNDGSIGPHFWKSRGELEKSYNDMEQFTFALSHDLKNSLTKLKLALSLAEEEEDIPESLDNYMQIIHRSAERLERTMLSLNRIIEVGNAGSGNVQKLSPPAVFNDVYDEFADSLAKINARIRTDFSGSRELHYVEAYLKSVFSNLLSNSIKYRSPEKELELDIAFTEEDGGHVLHFRDNGVGIDLERHREKLFLPFTRFSPVAEGSGLGLYLIKNMVERNGGRIELESRPGDGTFCRIYLREYHAGQF